MGKAKLFHRDFLLVVIGQIISLFGNAVLRLALPLYLLDATGSSALFGVVTGVAFLPLVALTPVGGVVADRMPKARMMAALDFATCGLTVGLALLLGRAPLIPLMLVALVLLYAIQGAYQPAVSASMPLLAPSEQLVSANAVVNLVSSLAGLLGPALGGLLYGILGLQTVLWVSAGCFAASAVLELFLHIPHTPIRRDGALWRTVQGDLSASLRFLFREQRGLANSVWVICVFNLLFSAMLIVGLPVIVTQHLGLSKELYGFAEGALGAGGLLGGGAVGVLGRRLIPARCHWLLLLCGLAAAGISLPLALEAPAMVSYGVLLGAAALEMALSAMFSVVMLSTIQARTPEQMVGKVVACVMGLSLCAAPLGQVLYGVLFEYLPAWWAVQLSGIAAIGIAMAARRVFSTL